MSVWQIVFWIVGTLGIGGAIVLLVLFPSVVTPIINGIIRLFGLVLSTRIGCAILAAIVAGFIALYWQQSRDNADFAARTAAFEVAQAARDKRIADETRDAVWTEIANQTALNAETDKDVKDFTDALLFPPITATGNPFRVGTDADRLCRIAGQTQCGPRSPQGVPAAKGAGASPSNKRGLRLPHFIRPGAGAAQKGKQ